MRLFALKAAAAVALAIMATACSSDPGIVDTTRLGDTFDRLGPYDVRVVLSGTDAPSEMRLVFRVDDGAARALTMSELREGIYEASIPGQPAFSRVRYHVELDDGDATVTDPPDAAAGGRFTFWVLGAECVTDKDCGAAESCDAQKVCRRRLGPCQRDVDCGKGFSCGVDGRCRLARRPCGFDLDCLTGEVCDGTLRVCAPRPSCDPNSGSCPLGFACDRGLGTCRRTCGGHSECLPGERCDGRTCVVASVCSRHADCSPGQACDPVARACRPQGASLCAPCAADTDCGGPTDFCLRVGERLSCARDCTATPCPSGYTCDRQHTPAQCVPNGGNGC